MCTFFNQNLLTCVQQNQTPSIYAEYFYFTCEYYLHLEGKRFWMINITSVIEFCFFPIFPKIDPWQKTETEKRISL